MKPTRSPIDWLFRSRVTGRITIAQFPNAPLWLYLATAMARRFLHEGALRNVLNGVGLVALGWWALDEVLRGVNPWRRLVGVGGCVLVVAGTIAAVRHQSVGR